MNQKKGLTLAAGIIEIIYSALMMLGGLVIAIMSASLAGAAGGSGTEAGMLAGATAGLLVAIGIIAIGIAVMFLIFGIKTVKYSKLPNNEFNAKYAANLTFGVIEIVLAVFMLISLCTSFDAVSMITFIIFCLIPTFRMIDIFKFKKLAATENSGAETSVSGGGTSAGAENVDLATELTRLNGLKEKGVISEEEYNSLKSNAIEKYTK